MFPTLVYRCPGLHQRPGGTYSYRAAKDQAQLDAALDDGWFMTLPEAIIGKAPAPIAPEPIIVPYDAPPTRDELEQKANELGVKFDGRTGDKKLASLIEDML